MSWLRTAVNKAVEVGNRKNITRIKNYADSVVQQAGQAVAEGAKLFQDRIVNFSHFPFFFFFFFFVSLLCLGKIFFFEFF